VRGGRPSSPRSQSPDLGLQEEADRVRVPRHRAGPPETLTDTDYANLLRVPDRRAVIGKRDVALLRVLGDCGLRSAELRELVDSLGGQPLGLFAAAVAAEPDEDRLVVAQALPARERMNGKPRIERGLGLLGHADLALDAALAAHEQAVVAGVGARPPQVTGGETVNRAALAAGVPERLCHPHALRSYWATTLLSDKIPAHVVQAELGHADLRTTGRYAVVRPEHHEEVVDVLDRRHQASRRSGG
jgi:site-specific recombinase XerD